MQRPRHNTKIVRNDDSNIDPNLLTQKDFDVETLPRPAGHTGVISPMTNYWETSEGQCLDEEKRIMYDPRPNQSEIFKNDKGEVYPVSNTPFTIRLASARRTLHFAPDQTVVGIVTCGGLCPGLNDVVRALTLSCIRHYNVKRVLGYRYGFWGLSAAGRDSAIDLSADVVRHIHTQGGTFLGTSRGPQKRKEMVETLIQHGVNILFTIGGDGTQRGAETIATEARQRGLDIAVIGVPKTIDNDLSFSHRTFGYETAVAQAVSALRAAHAEASSHDFGVGIVKVMGRHSGFIAAEATISSAVVNICLIPEMPISEGIVHELLFKRFEKSNSCVICVAEGFGQNWFDTKQAGTDASGNKKLVDIGPYLSKKVSEWLRQDKRFKNHTVKYIDPSYMIRACPPSPADAAFCVSLASLAVHEAMAGTTNAIISSWYSNFVCVPIRLATSLRREVSVKGRLWRSVRELTVWLDEDTRKAKIRTIENELDALRRRQDYLKMQRSKL